MKILLTILFTFLSSAVVLSQEITIVDLKYLLQNDVEEANIYILKKGFSFYETQKDEGCDAIFWAKNRDVNSDLSEEFIAKQCFSANEGFIWYQMSFKLNFEKSVSWCVQNGYNNIKSEVSPFGDFCSTYSDGNFLIEFCSGINKATKINEYIITVKSIH
jgi:hypothetical protein